MAFDLSNRVAIVTGNSTGLGKAIGKQLGLAGAKVAINYANNKQRAETALAEYQADGIETVLVQADVTSEEGVDKLFSETENQLGNVDIIVPNATCSQPKRPIEDYDWDFYQSMIDFFIKSPYLLARRGLPHMKSAQWGRIINITSEVYQIGVAPFSAYVAAKGGQVGWTRSMSRELAPTGITVNCVAPGWIPVERHENDPQQEKDEYVASVPMQRWGKPDEVGSAVLYLASDEAAYVSGQTICVNGGNTPW